MTRRTASCATLAGSLLLMSIGAYAGMTTVTPAPSEDVVLNPGKGWVIYGRPSDHPQDVLDIGTLGYRRFEWSTVEPEEGKFNWKSIDDHIQLWADAGKQFAFGVMAASSHSGAKGGFVTPEWVFDAGAEYTAVNSGDLPHVYAGREDATYIVPDFDHPLFMAKLRNFVNALAERYDGNPHLAFIDMRSYGNWGENHMFPFGLEHVPDAAFKEHIRIHLDAFDKTRVCISCDPGGFQHIYDWAVSQGMAARRDGIGGNSDGHETARALGIAPAVFEFFGSYEFMKEKGWWDGVQDDKGNGYTLDECVENGKPSYISLSNWAPTAKSFLDAERPLIERIANRMGYHFVLEMAVYPETLSRTATNSIELTWRNKGVAYVYEPCVAAFALFNAAGQRVAIDWASACQPGSWAPDTTTTETARLIFKGVPVGEYTLAVGLFRYVGDAAPAYKLAFKGKTIGGWHLLGPVRVAD